MSEKHTAINGNRNIVGDHNTVIVNGAEGAPPPLDLDSPVGAEARARYLAVLSAKYSKAHSGAFVDAIAHDERVGNARRLDLLGERGVYVSLLLDPLGDTHLARGMQRAGKRAKDADELAELAERAQPQTWGDALAQTRPAHLAIIGQAGCGKTTLLRALTAALADVRLAQATPDLARALPEPRPLPIFFPLRAFAYACARGDACPDVPQLLQFIDAWTARWTGLADWPAGFLEQHVRQGRAWLLLDALDEVAVSEQRKNVRNVLHALADLLGNNGTRLMVTARRVAYEGVRLDDRFALYEMRELEAQQREEMAYFIYRGLADPEAARKAAELEARIQRSEDLQTLVRTPVMLWTAVVVQTLRGQLPETRAALYTAYVDILLRHSYKQYDEDIEALAAVVGGQFSLSERHEYLTYAAFAVHRRLEEQAEKRANDERAVSRRVLIEEILGPYLERRLDAETARAQAAHYLAVMAESGLLAESDAGYIFGEHLTMQEFLAGCYLGARYYRPEYAELLCAKVGNSWWEQVLLFAVGYLAEDRNRSSDTPELLELLAGQVEWPAERRLTHLTLAARALQQVGARLQRPSWYAHWAQRFARHLSELLYRQPTGAPEIGAVAQRQEAGLALGLLYGYPGDDGLTDPRFTGPEGLPEFIQIPPGEFWLGSTEEEVAHWQKLQGNDNAKREAPRHRVTLSAYAVAKYPATNAMYERFIKDGGYANPDFWAEAIAAGDWREGQVRDYWEKEWYDLPRYWNDTRWNNPSQPVVGVNWYEAAAYCCWLMATLNDGYEYRLPTEAEWERAARGPQGWAYPWGNDWRAEVCNSQEAGLAVTSPVGLFPAGASAEGIEDLAGNVWEWCADWYGPYQSEEPGERKYRVLRGGSWYNDGPPVCRCGFRGWYFPWNGYDIWGFRCVRTSPQKP